jgi:hypothetical protein
MQVRKVAVVATGALAAAAAMGSTPAFAADSGVPEVAPATLGAFDYAGKHRASDQAMREVAAQWLTAAPSGPQILSVANGTAVSALATQVCDTTVIAGVGLIAPTMPSDPADCSNGDVSVPGGATGGGVISALNGSDVDAASVQICDLTAVVGVGSVIPLPAPASCGTAQYEPGDPGDPGYPVDPVDPVDPGYGEPGYFTLAGGSDPSGHPASHVRPVGGAEQGAMGHMSPPQVLSLGNGSAISAGATQVCGTTAKAGVGATIPTTASQGPNCVNGDVEVPGTGGSDAVISILDNSALSVLPVQVCDVAAVAGIGAIIPVGSNAAHCSNG